MPVVAGKEFLLDSPSQQVRFMFLSWQPPAASARGQRAAILASPLHELTGFYSAVDCLTSGCGSERNFAVAELIRRAAHGWRGGATHAVLQRLWRAGRGCLVTGPILKARPAASCAASGGGGEGVATGPGSAPPRCARTSPAERRRLMCL